MANFMCSCAEMGQKLYSCRYMSWWTKRSRQEKYLLLGLLLAILIIILIIILTVKTDKSSADPELLKLCSTSECQEAAAKVLQKIDPSVNPCQDFYKFACGKYLKETVLPPSKTTVSFFTSISDKITKQLRTVLEKPIEETEPKYAALAKSLYQACMNTTEINSNSLPYLKSLFKEAGGWPVLEGENWNENSTNWTSTSYYFIRKGFDPKMFFQLKVTYGSEKVKRRFLLDQPQPLANLVRQKGKGLLFLKHFHTYMVNVAIALGADETLARKEMQEVLDLDVAITKITLTPEKRKQLLTSTVATFSVLEEKYPYVPWLEYANVILEPISKVMTPNDTVVVAYPNYIKQLDFVFKNTTKRTLINFIYAKIINAHAHYLDENIRKSILEFNKSEFNITESEPRWEECTYRAKHRLPMPAAALYVKHFFSEDAKNAILELVDYIKGQFIDTLKTVEWMDDTTRQKALEKIDGFNMYIGYPDELLDSQKVDQLFQNLTLSGFNYLESIQNVTIFYANTLLKTLDKPYDRKTWYQYAGVADANAYYNRLDNSIIFPAGILQDLTFDHRRPQYMNFGAIGFLIGHEITHGFDNFGRRYDKNGDFSNWWQVTTESAFNAKALCIVDQYNNIIVPEINRKINGNYSVNENIADNGGIKHAYLGYKRWVRKHGLEKTLPNLSYTPEQMFWISAGNTWCEVSNRAQMIIFATDSTHLPHKYRINVPLMNSEDFAKDFNCPKGSPMNPVHKCRVW